MPDKMKAILTDAKDAMGKVINEGMKGLKKLSGPDDEFFNQIKHCVSSSTNS